MDEWDNSIGVLMRIPRKGLIPHSAIRSFPKVRKLSGNCTTIICTVKLRAES